MATEARELDSETEIEQPDFTGAEVYDVELTGQTLPMEEQAKKHMYSDETGPYVPASHIKASMREAARDRRMEGRGKKSYRDYIAGGIQIYPARIYIDPPKWEVDERLATIRTAGIGRAIEVGRPRFDKWKLQFQVINRDPDTLQTTIVKHILEDAGKFKGIGSYTPPHSGDFGLFKVTKFEKRKEE
jgi:hypothetical protein